MSSVVELPLWFVILAGVFAAIALAERALIPSVRWYLRRRAEKLIARLNERLERPIEPFKLARRFDTIQRLIYDRDVLAAVAEHARDQGVPEDVAFEDARRYAREIVPSFSAFTYFKLGTRGARWLSRALYRVRLTHYDLALSNVPPDATVVFVMNHRSNMDYVLITHLASERSALSYAVGEWARIWPLSRLIRMMGAYFIRRKSRTALYRRVLDRYVQMATEAGVTQAIFPEGGLSLDGRLAPPKVGLLAYVLKAYVPGGRDIVFVPVALNYDRVLEDRMLIAADQAGERRFRGSIWEVLGFLGRQIKLRLTGGFHRFGYAAVSFGEPLAVSTYGEAVPGAEVLAGELMARIGAVVPALPVPLVAGLLMQEDGLSRETLVQRFAERVAQLPEASRHVPRDDPAYGAEVGLRMLTLRNLVRVQDGRIWRVPEEVHVLSFYARSVEHL